MGIHDRKYMSGPPSGGGLGNLPKTVTMKIVFICIGIYLLDTLLNGQLSQHLRFNTVAVRNFEIWRLLTPAFFSNTGSFIWVAISLYIFYSMSLNFGNIWSSSKKNNQENSKKNKSINNFNQNRLVIPQRKAIKKNKLTLYPDIKKLPGIYIW